MKTVITTEGFKKIILAGTIGPQIQVTKVKIGSKIIIPDSTMTDVADLVWEGDSTYIQYQVLSDDSFCYEITLDESVGDFAVGNIGLFLEDGTMFSLTAFIAQEQKYKTGSSTGIAGNRKVYQIPMQFSGASTNLNTTYLVADEASLPVVPSENVLPPTNSSNYSCYVVLNNTARNLPCLALRTIEGWSYVYGVDAEPKSIFYDKDFDPEDIIDGQISIPADVHNLGVKPFLTYVQRLNGSIFKDVTSKVTFKTDLDGNVTIVFPEVFTGRLLIEAIKYFDQGGTVISPEWNSMSFVLQEDASEFTFVLPSECRSVNNLFIYIYGKLLVPVENIALDNDRVTVTITNTEVVEAGTVFEVRWA